MLAQVHGQLLAAALNKACILQVHLMRVLRVASHLFQLDAATYAIQVLRCNLCFVLQLDNTRQDTGLVAGGWSMVDGWVIWIVTEACLLRTGSLQACMQYVNAQQTSMPGHAPTVALARIIEFAVIFACSLCQELLRRYCGERWSQETQQGAKGEGSSAQRLSPEEGHALFAALPPDAQVWSACHLLKFTLYLEKGIHLVPCLPPAMPARMSFQTCALKCCAQCRAISEFNPSLRLVALLSAQAIVRPYLDSKFAVRSAGSSRRGVVFGSTPGLSFHRWLFQWLKQLVGQAAGAPFTHEHRLTAELFGPKVVPSAEPCRSRRLHLETPCRACTKTWFVRTVEVGP